MSLSQALFNEFDSLHALLEQGGEPLREELEEAHTERCAQQWSLNAGASLPYNSFLMPVERPRGLSGQPPPTRFTEGKKEAPDLLATPGIPLRRAASSDSSNFGAKSKQEPESELPPGSAPALAPSSSEVQAVRATDVVSKTMQSECEQRELQITTSVPSNADAGVPNTTQSTSPKAPAHHQQIFAEIMAEDGEQCRDLDSAEMGSMTGSTTGRTRKSTIDANHMAEGAWTRGALGSIYQRSGFMSSDLTKNSFTNFVEDRKFKTATAALIILNSLYVGYEMDTSLDRSLHGEVMLETEEMKIANAIFTTLFTLELLIRMWAYRIHFFLGDDWQWNVFDASIVVSALAEYALSGLNGFSAMRALRAVRLAKTLRIIRVVTIFRQLQLLVQGLVNSLLSLIWMIFLMLLVVYLVAIVFCGAASNYLHDKIIEQAIADQSTLDLQMTGDHMTYAQIRFAFERDMPSILRAMYSLFLCVTGGVDWYTVLQPLMNISLLYAVIFAGFIIFVVFGVFNVLNAVFVESVLSNRDKDLLIQSEQNKTRIFMRDLANLFKEGDIDENKEFTMDELMVHCQNPRFCAYLHTHALDASDAQALFEMLDVDGSGTIDIEEFVLGAMKLKGNARCMDMLKMQSNFDRLEERVELIVAQVLRSSATQPDQGVPSSDS